MISIKASICPLFICRSFRRAAADEAGIPGRYSSGASLGEGLAAETIVVGASLTPAEVGLVVTGTTGSLLGRNGNSVVGLVTVVAMNTSVEVDRRDKIVRSD